MKKEKPLILLSNDDGVEAKGLNELIRGLRGMGEIIVMAPEDRTMVSQKTGTRSRNCSGVADFSVEVRHAGCAGRTCAFLFCPRQ